jgi:hypothetical protein
MMRHLALPCFLLAASASLAQDPAAVPAPADPTSFAVTTDTLSYCTQLAHDVETCRSPVPDVQRLLGEGREMCERGEIRGGIRRLRRAQWMLHHKVTRDDMPGP